METNQQARSEDSLIVRLITKAIIVFAFAALFAGGAMTLYIAAGEDSVVINGILSILIKGTSVILVVATVVGYVNYRIYGWEYVADRTTYDTITEFGQIIWIYWPLYLLNLAYFAMAQTSIPTLDVKLTLAVIVGSLTLAYALTMAYRYFREKWYADAASTK